LSILLDTHAFIWWADAPERLPKALLERLSDPGETVLLSIASLWEMQIKIGLGRLILQQSLRMVVEEQQRDNAIGLLSIEPRHLWALDKLPAVHGDPFDRLLIAQAHCDDLTLASCDSQFDAYPIQRLWN
jgi:PIN domain nuclease of toxin-antitoxin system